MGRADTNNVAAAAAWLATVAAETAATIGRAPRSTIVPSVFGVSTGGGRALALLDELAGHAGDGVELRIGKTIAEGGMGVIRGAEQVALARQVAVKTLKPSRRDRGAALDLLREAWITGSLEHPNVVPVHHLGTDADGLPLLVLKRIGGVEWSALIRSQDEVARRFGTSDLLAWNLGILLHVLNAVRFAHSRGIVHRDLKPSNVMIGDFGEVYLLDWGIAVSTRDDGSGRFPLAREVTTIAGTPCYLAPEMLGRGEGAPISEATDVYLAGAVLFELIAGRPPHLGASAAEVIVSVLSSQPELPPGAPAELAAICTRAMRAAPAERFASADAMRLAVQGYLEHRVSAQIAARAVQHLDELTAAVGAGQADREAIYRQLGACRAGFQEALAMWRDNAEARAGIERATIAVAQYELASGDPRAAVRLLGELEPAPPLLTTARAAAEVAETRQRELERMRHDLDPTVGRHTRWTVFTVLGVLFTVFPLVSAARPDLLAMHSMRSMGEWSVFFAALTIAGGCAMRRSLERTVLNRRALMGLLMVFAAQIALGFGASQPGLGLTLAQATGVIPLVWAVIAGMAALMLDGWFAITAVGYLAVFLITSVDPERRALFVGLGNLVFTLNAMWVWRPSNVSRHQPRDRDETASPERARPG